VCVSRGGHEAKRLTIQVEGNWLGIDPHVTPGGRNTAARARAAGGRNTAARARAAGGRATVVRRSEPGGPPSPPLEGKWELITDAAEGKPCSLRPLFSGAPTAYGLWSGPGGLSVL
jgi:hypothetical protein